VNTLLQVAAILAIAVLLRTLKRWPFRRAAGNSAPQPVAA
jgi:hypothetical protein